MAKGLLYFAQNSAFQHLTKIGKTTKLEVEDRGLSASNVPENFGYLAVFECDDVDWAEKKVHDQFAGFRHYTQSLPKRKTEFFWSGCIKDAINYARDLKGVHDRTETETEEIEVIDEGGEQKIKRVPNTTFKMIGVPVGSKICFEQDENKEAVTVDEQNKVKFNGKVSAISNISDELYKASGRKGSTNGFWHFYFNGKRLFDLRPDQQDKE